MKLNLPHFLFINGPPGSGKSTLAKLICADNPLAKQISFADPIRDMIWAVFFPEHILDQPFDLKDQEIKKAFLGELAKIYSPKENQTTVREAMIAFSEHYMKQQFSQDIFGKLLFNRACEESAWYEHFIIDDSGFAPEAETIVSRVGPASCHLIRLHRSGCNFSGDSRSYITLPGVKTLDLHNNSSSPDEMINLVQLEFGNI